MYRLVETSTQLVRRARLLHRAEVKVRTCVLSRREIEAKLGDAILALMSTMMDDGVGPPPHRGGRSRLLVLIAGKGWTRGGSERAWDTHLGYGIQIALSMPSCCASGGYIIVNKYCVTTVRCPADVDDGLLDPWVCLCR